MNYPVVSGADALFTYGSDGAVAGRLCGDRIGIRFETAMGCTLVLHMGSIYKIEYECVLPDWISGKAYCQRGEVEFEIIAMAPQEVYVSASENAEIRLMFDGDAVCEGGKEVRTYICNGETAALCISKKDGISVGFSMGFGCAEKARDIVSQDIKIRREALRRRYSSVALPRGISGRYEQVYRRCLALAEGSISTDGDRKAFAGRTAHGLCINSRQSMLAAVGLKKLFPELALSTVMYLVDFIDEKGILPANISGGFPDGGCAAPLLPWAFCEIAGDSKSAVKQCYEALRRHVMYFISERDMNKNSLYHWLAGGKHNPGIDSGMENSPRFDENVIVDAPDLGAYLYMSIDAMCRMSKLINENNDVLYWNVMAERVRLGVNDFLFDEADKFYYDRGVIGKKLNKIKTVAGFMPVFGGICPPVRLNGLIECMSDKNTFGAKFGIPSAARNGKTYISDMYRGAVYFEENYKIAYGLCKAGKRDKAAEIVSRCLEAACRGYETAGVIYEYYSPASTADNACQKRNGSGGGSMSLYGYNTCRRDCPVSAAFLVAMIELLSNED
ncbi:MAG: hypothetical protein IJ460_01660 [Clostridia bacterium]|nr:hypothetical protein [Clostridia bacterium]